MTFHDQTTLETHLWQCYFHFSGRKSAEAEGCSALTLRRATASAPTIFGVFLQNVSGGAYLAMLTSFTGLPEVVIATVKAALFGWIAGLVGCYRGLTVGGGSQGLDTAVNVSVVLWVIARFPVNVVLTTIGVRFGTGK